MTGILTSLPFALQRAVAQRGEAGAEAFEEALGQDQSSETAVNQNKDSGAGSENKIGQNNQNKEKAFSGEVFKDDPAIVAFEEETRKRIAADPTLSSIQIPKLNPEEEARKFGEMLAKTAGSHIAFFDVRHMDIAWGVLISTVKALKNDGRKLVLVHESGGSPNYREAFKRWNTTPPIHRNPGTLGDLTAITGKFDDTADEIKWLSEQAKSNPDFQQVVAEPDALNQISFLRPDIDCYSIDPNERALNPVSGEYNGKLAARDDVMGYNIKQIFDAPEYKDKGVIILYLTGYNHGPIKNIRSNRESVNPEDGTNLANSAAGQLSSLLNQDGKQVVHTVRVITEGSPLYTNVKRKDVFTEQGHPFERIFQIPLTNEKTLWIRPWEKLPQIRIPETGEDKPWVNPWKNVPDSLFERAPEHDWDKTGLDISDRLLIINRVDKNNRDIKAYLAEVERAKKNQPPPLKQADSIDPKKQAQKLGRDLAHTTGNQIVLFAGDTTQAGQEGLVLAQFMESWKAEAERMNDKRHVVFASQRYDHANFLTWVHKYNALSPHERQKIGLGNLLIAAQNYKGPEQFLQKEIGDVKKDTKNAPKEARFVGEVIAMNELSRLLPEMSVQIFDTNYTGVRTGGKFEQLHFAPRSDVMAANLLGILDKNKKSKNDPGTIIIAMVDKNSAVKRNDEDSSKGEVLSMDGLNKTNPLAKQLAAYLGSDRVHSVAVIPYGLPLYTNSKEEFIFTNHGEFDEVIRRPRFDPTEPEWWKKLGWKL